MKRLFYFIFIVIFYSRTIAGSDSVYVQIVDDTVKIWNVGAFENCCIKVVTSATIINDSIFVLEHDTSTTYCYCMCTFDFCVSVTGLSVGYYRVFIFRQYTLFTPDSLYFIDLTSFTYGGGGTGNLKSAAYQSACYYPPVKVDGEQNNIPTNIELDHNYPNPFNPSTIINYSVPPPAERDLVPIGNRDGQLPIESWVTLKVYDLLGRELETIVNEKQEAGFKTVNFNADKLPSGVYLYKLNAGKYSEVKKMLLVR